MAEKVVTCRHCGAQGIEDETDPAPGVCPSCLVDLVEDSWEMLANACPGPERAALLRSIGLTAVWADFYAQAGLMIGAADA